MVTVHLDVPGFGVSHNVRIGNEHLELILSTDFGPRVLACAPRGGDNLFGVVPPSEQAKPTIYGEPWHIYGGHRLWRAPEHAETTYVPDNNPVDVTREPRGVVLTRRAGPNEDGLEKSLRVTLQDDAPRARVEHRLTNRSEATMPVAVWALTVMKQGGQAILPNAAHVPHPVGLLPVRPLVLWPYSWLGDPRFTFGRRYLRVRHDPAAREPQKIGLFNERGWAAYATGSALFVKRFPGQPGRYADLGCNNEVFVDGVILELESLGPLVDLDPGATISHEETWHVFTGVRVPDDDEAAAAVLEPLLAAG